ncbi:hypothetical protein [Nocardioides sp. InS609-2]|uniref:hypothetical protein n=1 Tax=Nocardioides sp. InS609-2 TaxID=2760705 RepID=UPI0020BF3E11|nr:hypothetical protein [Nocardioides sp. InS609-2]
MLGRTAAVQRIFREEHGRPIASLVAALQKWPESGIPPTPAADDPSPRPGLRTDWRRIRPGFAFLQACIAGRATRASSRRYH